MPSKKTAAAAPPPENYGAAVRELEQLVVELESGELPLEALLGRYQRGNTLLAYCRAQLQAVENQIKVLEEDGTVTPWQSE